MVLSKTKYVVLAIVVGIAGVLSPLQSAPVKADPVEGQKLSWNSLNDKFGGQDNSLWKAVDQSSDGQRIAAAVAGGFIYTSSDAGESWQERINSGSRLWESLAMSDDGKTIVATPGQGNVMLSPNMGADWTALQSSGSKIWRSVAVSGDGNKIAALGDLSLSLSNDKGQTWYDAPQALGGGWSNLDMSADGMTIMVNNYVESKVSYDGGVTWSELGQPGTDLNGTRVAVSRNGQHLIFRQSDTELLVSNNSGQTWATKAFVTGNPETDIPQEISISDNGQVIGLALYYSIPPSQSQNQLWVSQDGANSWVKRIDANNSNAPHMGVSVGRSGNQILAFRSFAAMQKSTNSGAAFTGLLIRSAELWYSLDASESGDVILGGTVGGKVYLSVNHGETWVAQDDLGSGQWVGAEVSNDGNTLLAVTSTGAIYSSTNSGATWTTYTPANSGWTTVSMSNDGNNFVIGRSSSTNILVSNDSGASWNEKDAGTNVTMAKVGNDGSILATGYYGMVYSPDLGDTWQSRTPVYPATEYGVQYVFKSNDDFSVITMSVGGSRLSDNKFIGAAHVSRDKGLTWTEVSSPREATNGLAQTFSVTHVSANGQSMIGVASNVNESDFSVDARIYESFDSGENWSLIEIKSNDFMQQVGNVALSGIGGFVPLGDNRDLLLAQYGVGMYRTIAAEGSLFVDGERVAPNARRTISARPTFSGGATYDSTVMLRSSAGETLCEDTAGVADMWSCEPTEDLVAGLYSIDVESENPLGETIVQRGYLLEVLGVDDGSGGGGGAVNPGNGQNGGTTGQLPSAPNTGFFVQNPVASVAVSSLVGAIVVSTGLVLGFKLLRRK